MTIFYPLKDLKNLFYKKILFFEWNYLILSELPVVFLIFILFFFFFFFAFFMIYYEHFVLVFPDILGYKCLVIAIF